MIDRKNVRINEFVDKNDEARKEEPKDYNKFVYVYEDAPYSTLKQQQRTTKHQLALPKSKT